MTELAYLCVQHDLILKITYCRCIGWCIQIHKKGYDMPIVDVSDYDREAAFIAAIDLVKVRCTE